MKLLLALIEMMIGELIVIRQIKVLLDFQQISVKEGVVINVLAIVLIDFLLDKVLIGVPGDFIIN